MDFLIEGEALPFAIGSVYFLQGALEERPLPQYSWCHGGELGSSLVSSAGGDRAYVESGGAGIPRQWHLCGMSSLMGPVRCSSTVGFVER
jgi:hypothetical protein